MHHWYLVATISLLPAIAHAGQTLKVSCEGQATFIVDHHVEGPKIELGNAWIDITSEDSKFEKVIVEIKAYCENNHCKLADKQTFDQKEKTAEIFRYSGPSFGLPGADLTISPSLFDPSKKFGVTELVTVGADEDVREKVIFVSTCKTIDLSQP